MKHLFTLLLTMSLALSAFAQDFEVDGICYRAIGSDRVAVAQGDSYKRQTMISIPSSVTHGSMTYKVTQIDKNTFSKCPNLCYVAMPNTIESIGEWAFRDCRRLRTLQIPASVRFIGRSAFGGCGGLTFISVDKDNPVFDSRDNCNAIIETATNTLIRGCAKTVIPNTVTAIGYCAFSFCSNLTAIEIPNTVTAIDGGAFSYCYDLRSVSLPEKLTKISYSTFSNCLRLDSVIIPDSVTVIEEYAFFLCKGVTSVVIGSSVKSIRQRAFAECIKLSEVTCLAVTPPSIDIFTFSSSPSVTFCVPSESLSAYESADVWKKFFLISLPGEPDSND